MAEDKLHREIENGHRANEILEAQPFKDAVAAIRDRVMRELVQPKPDQERLRQIDKLQALNELLAEIRLYLETGQLAQVQITEERSRLQKMKEAVVRRFG